MAETTLHITQTGTLPVEADTLLRYDDTRDVVAHDRDVLVYRAVTEATGAAYHARVPLTADAETRLLGEFHLFTRLAQTTQGLPQVALAQQTDSINTALILPIYETRLSDLIQAHILAGQPLLAERTAVQAAIDYTYIVESLRTLDPPRSCISQKTTDFFMHDGRLIVPGWHTLVEPTREALASEISLFGQIWHALFLDRYGAAPLYPFHDERWQTTYDMPEGVLSVGLRTVIAAALQTPGEARFVDEQGLPSSAVLRRVLQSWQERLLQTPDELATLDAWALFGFTELLPMPLPRAEVNAVWQDILWRIHRAAGLPLDKLHTARTIAIEGVREPLTDADAGLRRQQAFVATGEYPVVIEQITAPEGLQQFKDAVINGAYHSADWLYTHIMRDAATNVEREWIAHELEPYLRYMQFMLHYDDLTVLMTTPPPVTLNAAEPILNDTRLDDKTGLHRVVVQCATLALVRVEEAVHVRTWAAARAAYPAYRAFIPDSRERAVIDRLRPLFPDALRFEGLGRVLDDYQQIYQTYLKLFEVARSDPFRRLTGTTATPAMSRLQALETLNLLNTAQELELDMSEIVDSDDQTRRQWQQLVNDALTALKQVEGVQGDLDTLRAGVDRVDAMARDMADLKLQVQGSDDVGGLMQQMRDLAKRLDDFIAAPGDTRAKLTADLNELRQRFALMERDVRENSSATGRLTAERVPRMERLLDDVRERFEQAETMLQRATEYETGLLVAYLEWVARLPDPETPDAAADGLQGLVYAVQRCPAEAYTPAAHQGWSQAFARLLNCYEDAMTAQAEKISRLRGRRRQKFEEERREALDKFAICQQEAANKALAHTRIHEKKA